MLNRVQTIGVRHFDEFLERMQREEVAEIEAKVRQQTTTREDRQPLANKTARTQHIHNLSQGKLNELFMYICLF